MTNKNGSQLFENNFKERNMDVNVNCLNIRYLNS